MWRLLNSPVPVLMMHSVLHSMGLGKCIAAFCAFSYRFRFGFGLCFTLFFASQLMFTNNDRPTWFAIRMEWTNEKLIVFFHVVIKSALYYVAADPMLQFTQIFDLINAIIRH